MNNLELKALRKLFMLDVKEAAKHVGAVSVRTWQYWESGRSPVPQDVHDKMHYNNGLRTHLYEAALSEAIAANDEGEVMGLCIYETYEEWVNSGANADDDDYLLWRINQSIVTRLYSEGLGALV